MPRHDHIFLNDTGMTIHFSSIKKGGGTLTIPSRPNRQAHSEKLLSQFLAAQEHFQNYTPAQVAAISYNTGTYLEFEGAKQCDLVTKSLESSKQGIKLLNVRDVVTLAEDGSELVTTKATVYIPKGKENSFLRKISDFATKNTKPTEKNLNGNPKYNDFVSSIEAITAAITIAAFWIGKQNEMPTDTNKWYELWIDTSNEDFDTIKHETFAVLDSLSIRHSHENSFIQILNVWLYWFTQIARFYLISLNKEKIWLKLEDPLIRMRIFWILH
jgi:hypothetical protein